MHPNIRKARPVGLQIALRVTPKSTSHSNPRLPQHQLAHLASHRVALRVHNVGCHAGQWSGKRTWLERAQDIAHENAPGDFRAPGVVKNWKPSGACRMKEPLPRLRIPWFARRTKFAQ